MTWAGSRGALMHPMTMSDARARHLGHRAKRNKEDGGKPALPMLPSALCGRSSKMRDWVFAERLEAWAKTYGKEFSAYTAMEALGVKHTETMRQALFLGPFRTLDYSKVETPNVRGRGRQMFIYDATMIRPTGSPLPPSAPKVRPSKPPGVAASVRSFLEAHPGSTICEIATGVDTSKGTVISCLKQLRAVENGWRQVRHAGRPAGIWFLNKSGA